ncbi:MAG: metallophosphoesterase [Bradyrhizobium sp.]
MPTRIAHLSDLHYGRDFDTTAWQAVATAVANFNPSLLIVSGDLVDDPRRDHLVTAQQVLQKLANEVGAELYVVPGNHDVFFSGVDVKGNRSGLYYEIFDRVADPDASSAATATVSEEFARPAGRWAVRWDRFKVWCGLGIHAGPQPAPPAPRPDGVVLSMLREPANACVLLALIDSNAGDQPIRMATGSVSTDHLTALDAELGTLSARLRASGIAHLARIAVIHHHVLPIAYTAGGVIGAEPFMVLHNAGDVLGILAKHQFDLVLHGHKHRAQFARIYLSPDSAEGYPIAVAAAGSAALQTPNNPTGNSFNLITIKDNGRLEVESLHYGAGNAPNRNGRKGEAVRTYTESMESTKRRAFIRACQRYPIYCRRRSYHFQISELGDFTLHHRTEGLRALKSNVANRHRPHVIGIPSHGRLALDLKLDQASLNAGYAIDPLPRDASDTQRMVVLPWDLEGEREASYTVSHTCANAIKITRWEAEERARALERTSGKSRDSDWDQEGVGCYVSHPVEELHFKLSLPPSLSDVRPYIRCDRQRGFPNYAVSATGNAEVTAPPAFDIDSDMETAEGQSPNYSLADGMWHLTVHRPVVGYRYRLRWQTPGLRPAEPTPGQTLQWRDLLLSMADRVQPSEADIAAWRVFDLLADELEKRLAFGSREEYRSVELFVYDAGRLALRPVMRRSSRPDEPDWRAFSIPLGDGIAGAAFLRRCIVPWAEQDDSDAFIKPVPNPALKDDLKTILAIPVYHPDEEEKPRPSPWSTIGVLSFGSSSPASKIPPLLNQLLSMKDKDMVRILRGLAQSHVHEIIAILSQPTYRRDVGHVAAMRSDAAATTQKGKVR